MSAPVNGVQSREAAARDLLTALYPPPLTVGTSAVGPVRAAWSAVPSAGSPRLLLPVAGRTASTRMLRRQLTGERPRTRAARAGLSLAAGSGVLPRLPGMRLEVSGPVDAPSIEDPLRQVLGVDRVCLTMPIGPPRANRKPVLQVADRDGRILAFAKVGHTPLTRRLVRREGDALRRLEQVAPGGIRFPRALASLTWAECDVVVLEPLDIPARRLTGEAAGERLVSLVLELASVAGRTLIGWQAHPYRAALLARIEGCGAAGEVLRRQLQRIGSRVPLATGSWHGDLNAGNVALVRGPCPVWDWERFECGVPVGFDLLHHRLHESISNGLAARAAASRLLGTAAQALAPLGVDPAASDAVARTYLVTLACRYLNDDQSGAGAALGRVHEWLFPALEEGA